MGALTEHEIFSQMTQSFALAAEACLDLASNPVKSPAYNRLRDELRLIEGCCRQASYWREDTRWLPIGLMMAECHKRAGDWLRGVKLPSGRKVALASGEMHPCFLKLSANLRMLGRAAETLRDSKPPKLGLILPDGYENTRIRKKVLEANEPDAVERSPWEGMIQERIKNDIAANSAVA